MTMDEFRNQLARLRFIDRSDLPDGQLWDEDWPSFRDNPYRYFMVCSEKHQKDIWDALETDRTLTAAQLRDKLMRALTSVVFP